MRERISDKHGQTHAHINKGRQSQTDTNKDVQRQSAEMQRPNQTEIVRNGQILTTIYTARQIQTHRQTEKDKYKLIQKQRNIDINK